MIENVEAILGVELLAPAQAYEFQHPARARSERRAVPLAARIHRVVRG
jgi:histidine ammonia-lyase